MSRDYGKVSTSVWRSKRFKSLPTSYCPRLFYLYLHTCTHVNSTGCFWLPKGYIGADLNWSNSDIDRAIDTCVDTGLIAYDDAEEVVYIEKFLEHSPVSNAKHAIGALKQAEMLPSCQLKYRIIKELLASKWCDGLDGLEKYKALADRASDTPIDTTETETEPETNSSETKVSGVPPTDEAWVFQAGVNYLTGKAIPERQARSTIGRWRKLHGDTDIRQAIERAMDENPVEPVAWITAALKPKQRDGPKDHSSW